MLVGRSLDADVDVVLAGDGGRLVVADVAVKSFKFRLVSKLFVLKKKYLLKDNYKR